MHRLILVVAIALCGLAACEGERVYECAIGSSDECTRSDARGQCLAPGFCAFSDASCLETSLRWDSTAGDGLAGQCVATGGGNDTPNACGGMTVLPGVPGQKCGVCESGSFACAGTDALSCQGELSLEQNITQAGSVSASSIFSGSFNVGLSVDGDLGTSWFSAGPGADGPESVYSWTGDSDRCVVGIGFVGNEFHNNSNFRTGFGFGQVTFEVRDAADVLVFSRIHQLPENPDPPVLVDTMGVIGRSVHLRLQGHESNECGGFAELTVNAVL